MFINSQNYLLPTTKDIIYSLVNSITCCRVNDHGGHYVEQKMLPDDISTLFAEALEKFDPITGQPTDSHLTEIREVLSQILLVI